MNQIIISVENEKHEDVFGPPHFYPINARGIEEAKKYLDEIARSVVPEDANA
jgi:hypothetical protein